MMRVQGKAAEIACERIRDPGPRALHKSLEEACRQPADAGGCSASSASDHESVVGDRRDDPYG